MATIGTPFLFIPAKRKLLVGDTLKLSSDALKVVLCNNSQKLDEFFMGTSGDARFADLTGELPTGGGYVNGGIPLQNAQVGFTVVSATKVADGTGGTNGNQTLTGTTGAGTKFQANALIQGGVIQSINNVALRGFYTSPPTNPAAEPVTGAGLTGAQLAVRVAGSIKGDPSVWNNSSITAKYAVVFDSTATNKDLLLAVDLAVEKPAGAETTNGPFIVNWDAAGLAYLG